MKELALIISFVLSLFLLGGFISEVFIPEEDEEEKTPLWLRSVNGPYVRTKNTTLKERDR
ncbi:MAG: hypothetical protein LBQ90_00845 [Synergistaceae bacterium]|jgi:hypothetical protein|nr:hypothetical protein [Synergistaceae bacterium]